MLLARYIYLESATVAVQGSAMDYERPIATVDIVTLTLKDEALNVALYPRAKPPFEGVYALPGGYVHVDEDANLDATARRVLREKALLKGVYLEQLATFSGANRDPRGWSISAAYVALLPEERITGARLVKADPLPRKLPFDHRAIVKAALARVRSKSVYSTLPTFLMPDEFTITELRDVYQIVLGIEKIDLAGFRKKILDLRAIEPVEGRKRTGGHRPAQLYRRPMKDVALFDRTI